jgi:hypothetical protein
MRLHHQDIELVGKDVVCETGDRPDFNEKGRSRNEKNHVMGNSLKRGSKNLHGAKVIGSDEKYFE